MDERSLGNSQRDRAAHGVTYQYHIFKIQRGHKPFDDQGVLFNSAPARWLRAPMPRQVDGYGMELR